MSNGEEDATARDGAEVVCEGEDGPVVVDGAEVSVLGVGKTTVLDELGSDGGITTGLEGRTSGIGGGVEGRSVCEGMG